MLVVACDDDTIHRNIENRITAEITDAKQYTFVSLFA